jgi:hypothetical protein
MAWQMCQLLLYDIASDDTQHPAPIHVSGAICTISPCPRLRVRNHSIRSQAEDTRPRPHRCASELGWLAKDRVSTRQVQHESMGRSTGTQSLVRLQNQLGHRRRHAKLYASLVKNQGHKVRSFPSRLSFLANTNLLNDAADPAPTSQQHDTRTSFPHQELRQERTTPRRIRRAGLGAPLGSSSFSLPTVERTLEEMQRARRIRETHGRTDVAHTRERAESDTS